MITAKQWRTKSINILTNSQSNAQYDNIGFFLLLLVLTVGSQQHII